MHNTILQSVKSIQDRGIKIENLESSPSLIRFSFLESWRISYDIIVTTHVQINLGPDRQVIVTPVVYHGLKQTSSVEDDSIKSLLEILFQPTRGTYDETGKVSGSIFEESLPVDQFVLSCRDKYKSRVLDTAMDLKLGETS